MMQGFFALGPNAGIAAGARIVAGEFFQQVAARAIIRDDQSARRKGAVRIHVDKRRPRPAIRRGLIFEEIRHAAPYIGSRRHVLTQFPELRGHFSEFLKIFAVEHIALILGSQPRVGAEIYCDFPVNRQLRHPDQVPVIVPLDDA